MGAPERVRPPIQGEVKCRALTPSGETVRLSSGEQGQYVRFYAAGGDVSLIFVLGKGRGIAPPDLSSINVSTPTVSVLDPQSLEAAPAPTVIVPLLAGSWVDYDIMQGIEFFHHKCAAGQAGFILWHPSSIR